MYKIYNIMDEITLNSNISDKTVLV